MVSFIGEHRAEYGVRSICAQLPIAPSTYYEYKAREADPERWPPRTQRDMELQGEIRRAFRLTSYVCRFPRNGRPAASIPPKPLKAARRQLGIGDRMHDVAMP